MIIARSLLVWATALCFEGFAFADGAFPDELSVYLPANAPNRIMLGTNFGLVISEDAGQSWRFICEFFITRNNSDIVNFYKIGSDGAVLAISLVSLWRSTDGGCSWTLAGGSVSSLNVTDGFIDPNDPRFVVAVAASASASGLYPSHDGGLTFGPALYTTSSARVISVEIASTSGIIYGTQVTGAGDAYLLKSTDSGAHWAQLSLPVSSGTQPRIIAVDPADANKVYLRLLNIRTQDDAIAVTTDGGNTLTTLITLPGGTNYFSSFLHAADGTLYVGTISGDLYAEAPGETAFTRRAGPLTRCLGQRPGSSRIYVCADAVHDGFNLGYTDDGAHTFHPLMSFTQIAGPLTCPAVSEVCASWYALLLQTLGVGADGGTGTGPQPSGGSHCSGVGAGGLLGLLLVLHRWRSRRNT